MSEPARLTVIGESSLPLAVVVLVSGASFTGVTLMLTTESTEPPLPSLTTTVKESVPL